jgi:hypothetical protein
MLIEVGVVQVFQQAKMYGTWGTPRCNLKKRFQLDKEIISKEIEGFGAQLAQLTVATDTNSKLEGSKS